MDFPKDWYSLGCEHVEIVVFEIFRETAAVSRKMKRDERGGSRCLGCCFYGSSWGIQKYDEAKDV